MIAAQCALSSLMHNLTDIMTRNKMIHLRMEQIVQVEHHLRYNQSFG
jgi:hypothetical protein